MNLVYDVLQQIGNSGRRYLQFRESKHLFAKVFQGGADVVYLRSVDNQETVVTHLIRMSLYRRILAIMPLQIQLKLAAYHLRVDIDFHPVSSLAKHQQHRLVHVVVYQ